MKKKKKKKKKKKRQQQLHTASCTHQCLDSRAGANEADWSGGIIARWKMRGGINTKSWQVRHGPALSCQFVLSGKTFTVEALPLFCACSTSRLVLKLWEVWEIQQNIWRFAVVKIAFLALATKNEEFTELIVLFISPQLKDIRKKQFRHPQKKFALLS